MKTYSVRFTGRKVGAIGSFEQLIAQVFAVDPDAAILALYDHFEHIQPPQDSFGNREDKIDVKEIPSPFDSELLVNIVQNTGDDHKQVRLYVHRLRMLLDHIAKRQAKANADWHDDPESNDHLLYHAPSDLQFPREARDAAILELVSRHLEVLNENETAAKERTTANAK